MSVYRIVMQQADASNAGQAVPARTGSLHEQIRQITLDAQAAARDARQAAAARKASAVDAARAGRQITIGDHELIVGPHEPAPPVMPAGVSIDRGGMDNVIPPQAVDMAIGFFIMCAVMVIGWPLARAFGRRIERRGETAALDPALTGQLRRIEQAVDAMAIEIERISESQRFMAKLQNGATERGALPSVERR